MPESDPESPGFNAKSPSVARVYDAMLGGKDNFEADRSAVAQLAEIAPLLTEIVGANKRFQARAVSWLADQGITQFADLGCGMPTAPNTHETAQEVSPGARVAYVDMDQVAINHMGVFAQPGSGVTAVHADVRDAAKVRATLADAIDFSRPVAVIMCAMLHFHDKATARELIAAYTAGLAPGSYLVVTVAGGEGEVTERFVAAYSEAVAPVYPCDAAGLASLLGGFELVPPGVTAAELWRPEWPEVPDAPERDLWAYAAVARVSETPG